MAANYPISKDDGTSLPYPAAGNFTNSPSNAGIQDNQNDAIIAIETKLGIGSSTPTANKFLIGTGIGSSGWSNTVPSGTVVGTSDIQTLTNKTLTSPTINSPTITNATISTDLITGYSAATNGTVYGISVVSGQIDTAAYKDASVTMPKITNPYKFNAYMSATMTTVATTWTKLQMDTEEYDTNSNYNTTTYGYTAPVTGYYLFSLMAQLLSQAGLPFLVSFSKDGTTEYLRCQEIPNTGGNITLSGTHLIKLNAGEILYPMYFSGSAGKTLQSGVLVSKFSGILLSI